MLDTDEILSLLKGSLEQFADRRAKWLLANIDNLRGLLEIIGADRGSWKQAIYYLYLLIFFQRSAAEHERLTGIVSEHQRSLRFSGEEAALMQSMAAYYLEQGKAEGIEQGKAEGIEQGKAEGIEQGKAEGIAAAYQQWQTWNARRMEAEAKGEPFDEPPPTQEPS